ncbi:RHS repeat-associated core domain-containing protein [Streptomyces sp. NPDC093088]|uniref:RHS repeat-associated core domain-containing protein n=1 Tax=Streptomyces sp. NPDC093088 TaxID=3366023 RepID=UPI0038233825
MVTGALSVGLLGGPVAAAAEAWQPPKPKDLDPVQVQPVAPQKQTARQKAAAATTWRTPGVVWPAPASADTNLGTPAAASPFAERAARVAPIVDPTPAVSGVRVRKQNAKASERTRVNVLGQDAARRLGVEGVVLSVEPLQKATGEVRVELDYDAFRGAYGGDWASRLTLRELPACALTTPGAKGCATGKELPTSNDVEAGRLSAPVTLAAAAGQASVLVATAAASGSSGNFGATSLSPSGSWSAGGSSGGFSWSYDIGVPEVPGDVSPELKLGYSSLAIDGRTAKTNNQPGGIGDGWSMEPGYIERQYVPCTDDKTGSNNTTAKVGDLCWKKDNAVLNLNGRTNQLIWDTASKTWHLEADDGTTIVKATSTAADNYGDNNGDDNGEYWKVTTPDGTQYYFGANRMDGWATGKTETRSTWTVPVFGNHSGEPCYNASFKDAWCQQAWRWNLDLVVDPHGDAMTYYWGEEGNYYGRNVNPDTGASTATAYDRSGYLKRIEYGLRTTGLYGQPAAKVEFTHTERCLTNCTTFDKTNAKNWPDVPFDQYCASGTECKDRYSPSFWTRMKLSTIATSVWSANAWKPVDSWALDHDFPAAGDGASPLWLKSITRTGHTGTGAVKLPAVTFGSVAMRNRVEGATTRNGAPDPVPGMWRLRVAAVNTESGGTIGVTYTPEDCSATSVPSPDASNTRRCYPVKWSPPEAPGVNYDPYLDWFHAYAVSSITENDNTGGSPAKRTDYTYLDGMAWRKAKDDEFAKAEHLTYGDRKGFGRVQVRGGSAPFARTLKEYRYFRGIPGAAVKDSEDVAVTDHEAFTGMVREEATYNGDGGKLESVSSFRPWVSAATATEKRAEGLPDLHAYITGGAEEKARTAVGAGWRTTQTDRTYDDNGNVLTESRLGDTAKTGDEECTTTTYAPGSLLGLASEIRTVAKACGTTPSLPADLISVERRYYDGATSLTTAPTKGDVTRIDEQDAAGTGHLTTAKHTYDQHGRELTETDALDRTTTTAYTPATGIPTSTTVTNALGHTATTTYDPVRGVAVASVDANNKRTDAVHDGLGRVLKVWQPGWPKTGHENQPSVEYAYKISTTEANAVTTKTLKQNGEYNVAHALYDGLLRERQSQAPAGGTQHALMTETRYDTRGWVWKSFAPYYAEVAPSAKLYTAKDAHQVDNVTENTYDGLGRVTDAVSLFRGDEKWRTTTAYEGDRVTVTPPKGGTATTTVTDATGRTTELIEYAGAGKTQPQSTTYAYGKYDEPTEITDPAGNTWKYTYDNRGQKVQVVDPDKGTSVLTYDVEGQVVAGKDARNTTLTTVYDKLGRKTEVKNGATTLSKWTYDTLAKGQLTSSSRFDGGVEYKTAIGGFDDRYQPTSTTLTVPTATAAGALAGTYTWSYGYAEKTGAPLWTRNPAVGDIPAELVVTDYNGDDQPFRTTRAGNVLVSNVQYDVFGRPVGTEFGDALDKKVFRTQAYDEHTGRLIERTTDRFLAPQRVDRSLYAYDPAGNVTGITSTTGQDAGASTDRQCFTNDPLGRLTEAWTAKTDCATAPTTTSVGGPNAYWLTYGYDKLGNRTEQKDELGGATTAYTHPEGGAARPHAVQQATVTGGPDDGRVSSFQYDATGNTTKRTVGTKVQDLTWDAEGHLATLTEGGTTTGYLYDADGDRLIAKNADGSRVLSLPNGDELKAAANGTKAGTRYYTHGGETVAVRTGASISYLIGDHQGTSQIAVDVVTLGFTQRKQLPFGELRTAQSSVFGSRGFVGGTNDPTGLTHLGAREYDPTTGRFLSVDPIVDFGDPAQMNAYAYGHNNPITKSDPTGLRPDGPVGGNGVADYYWAKDRGMTTGYYTKKSGKYVWNQSPRKDSDSQRRYKAYKANPSNYKVYHYDAKKAEADKARAKAQAAKRAAEERRKETTWGKIKGFWEEHKETIVHQAISIGVGFGAGIAAAALCAGTAGLGCVLIAGAAVGALAGTPAHLLADKAMGHDPTGKDAAKYLVLSAGGGGFQGGFRAVAGAGPLVAVSKLAGRGAVIAGAAIGRGASVAGGAIASGVRTATPVVVSGARAAGQASLKGMAATGRAQARAWGAWY